MFNPRVGVRCDAKARAKWLSRIKKRRPGSTSPSRCTSVLRRRACRSGVAMARERGWQRQDQQDDGCREQIADISLYVRGSRRSAFANNQLLRSSARGDFQSECFRCCKITRTIAPSFTLSFCNSVAHSRFFSHARALMRSLLPLGRVKPKHKTRACKLSTLAHSRMPL